MHALRQDILPPSGVEFAAHLNLTPACLNPRHRNLVVARTNLLRILEVVEESQGATRLYLVREHKLHGIVTGLSGVKVVSEDGLDRLLVSFKDAKVRCFTLL